MASFFNLELDTTAPTLTIDFPSIIGLGQSSTLTITSNEPLNEAFSLSFTDADSVVHALAGELDGSVITCSVDTSEFAKGIGTFSITAKDATHNEVTATLSTKIEQLTQLETYGATYGLDTTTFVRLKNGFDAIREYDGWEFFKIPEYIWDYVDQGYRDVLLSNLTTWFYDNKTEQQFTDIGSNREIVFALSYAIMLFNYWFIISNEQSESVYATAGNDYQIPTEQFEGYDSGYLYVYKPWDVNKQYYELVQLNGDVYPSTGNYTSAYVYPLAPDDYTDLENYLDPDPDYENYYEDYDSGTYVEVEPLVVGDCDEWPNGYFATFKGCFANGQELESGYLTISEWGIASGTIKMQSEPTVGEKITVSKFINSESVDIFTGIVMGFTYDLVNHNYSIRIADIVSAKAYDGVVYSDGNPITILQSVIEGYGGTFTSDITTDEIFYSTEEEVEWTTLVKSICLAFNAILVYNPDGSYHLTDSFATHSLDNDTIFADSTVSKELNVDSYKNLIYATVDDEWEEDWEEADGETVDVFENLKLRITITRKGNQIVRIVTKDKIADTDTQEDFTYDVDGYLTEYTMTKEETYVKHELTKTFTITDDSNYDYDIVEKFWEKWPGEDFWRESQRITTEAEVHLDGVTEIEVVTMDIDRKTYFEEGTLQFELRNSTKEVYEIVDTGIDLDVDSEFAIKQRVVNKSYTWQPICTSFGPPPEYEYGWWFVSVNTAAGNPSEELVKTPAVIKYSISLKVSASDETSISALTKELDEEITLIGINNITLLEEAAKEQLRRRARVRELKFDSVLNKDIKMGDIIVFNGNSWNVTSITHTPSNNSTAITAKQNSTLAELQVALEVITNSPIKELIKAMKRQDNLIHNVTRGKIIEVLDNETYTVEVQK